jgi:hypothetical protein
MSSTVPAAQLRTGRPVVTHILRPALVLIAAAAALAPAAGARPVARTLVTFGLASGEPVWALAPDRSVTSPDGETRIQLFRGEAGTPAGTLAPVPGGGTGAVTIAGAPGALAVARQTVVSMFRGDIGTPVDRAAAILPGSGPASIGVCTATSVSADVGGTARWAPVDADGGLIAACSAQRDAVVVLDGSTGAEVDRIPARSPAGPRIAGDLVAYVDRDGLSDADGDVVVFDRGTRRERYRLPADRMAHVRDLDLTADGRLVLILGGALPGGPAEVWTATPADPVPRQLPVAPSPQLRVVAGADRLAFSRWDDATHREQIGTLGYQDAAPWSLASGIGLSLTIAFDGERVLYSRRTCDGADLVTTTARAPYAGQPLPRCFVRLAGPARVSPTGRVVLRLDCRLLATPCAAGVTGATVDGIPGLRPVRAGGLFYVDGTSELRLTTAAFARLRARGHLTLQLRVAFYGFGPERLLTVRLASPPRQAHTAQTSRSAASTTPA